MTLCLRNTVSSSQDAPFQQKRRGKSAQKPLASQDICHCVASSFQVLEQRVTSTQHSKSIYNCLPVTMLNIGTAKQVLGSELVSTERCQTPIQSALTPQMSLFPPAGSIPRETEPEKGTPVHDAFEYPARVARARLSGVHKTGNGAKHCSPTALLCPTCLH